VDHLFNRVKDETVLQKKKGSSLRKEAAPNPGRRSNKKNSLVGGRVGNQIETRGKKVWKAPPAANRGTRTPCKGKKTKKEVSIGKKISKLGMWA